MNTVPNIPSLNIILNYISLMVTILYFTFQTHFGIYQKDNLTTKDFMDEYHSSHVLRRKDGHVLRREDGHVLRRALDVEVEGRKGGHAINVHLNMA